MLQWCLTQSLQSDGSFKVSGLDDIPMMRTAMEYGSLRRRAIFGSQTTSGLIKISRVGSRPCAHFGQAPDHTSLKRQRVSNPCALCAASGSLLAGMSHSIGHSAVVVQCKLSKES
jgi:hypothetical protein